jgi:hypothetical protein
VRKTTASAVVAIANMLPPWILHFRAPLLLIPCLMLEVTVFTVRMVLNRTYKKCLYLSSLFNTALVERRSGKNKKKKLRELKQRSQLDPEALESRRGAIKEKQERGFD